MKTTITALLIAALAGCAGDDPEIGSVPTSLRGTQPDGALTVDAAGRFVADEATIRLFDYFLIASGELDPDAIRAMAEAEIRARATGAVADQALDALARYLDYRAGVAEILADAEAAPGAAVARLEALHADTVADMPGLAGDPALFARAAAIRDVLADPDLDAAEREAALAQIEAKLGLPGARLLSETRTESVRATDPRAPRALRVAESALRADGGSDADVHALRARSVGEAAAARLAAVDAARAEWRARMAAYRAERDRVTAGLPAAQREAAADAIRARHFAPAEVARARATE